MAIAAVACLEGGRNLEVDVGNLEGVALHILVEGRLVWVLPVGAVQTAHPGQEGHRIAPMSKKMVASHHYYQTCLQKLIWPGQTMLRKRSATLDTTQMFNRKHREENTHKNYLR